MTVSLKTQIIRASPALLPGKPVNLFADLEDPKTLSFEEEHKQLHNADPYNQIPESQKPKNPTLQFLEKHLLRDESVLRKFAALGNDVAEASYEMLASIFPKPIAYAIYAGLWTLSWAGTGIRVVVNALTAAPGTQVKAGAKLLIHDFVSGILAPTVTARVANTAQNKVYNLLHIPAVIRHPLRTIGSLIACYFTIGVVDPHSQRLSTKLTGLTDDRHSQLNGKKIKYQVDGMPMRTGI